MNHIVCPNCNANITADDTQVFVYCMYCGVKIQIKDIVEVRHVNVPESIEKMLSDGETYCKIEDYRLAERKFREVIKQYPKEQDGYEGLIRVLTRNETVYPLAHETEVLRLLYEAEQLSPAEEKETFTGRRERMLKGFDAERMRVEEALSDREIDIKQQGREDRWIYTILVLTVVSTIGLLFLLLEFFPPIGFSVTMLIIAGGLLGFIWRDYR